MIYRSSKGEIEIAKMPLRYANNALEKLKRDEPGRAAEIEALEQHCASLAELAEQGEDRPVRGIGDNNPPEEVAPVATGPQSWDAVKLHMDDLLEQVRGITGLKVEDQKKADQVAQLLTDIQKAAKTADSARIAEKAPHDEVIKEIQDRYNAYIAPIKNKVPGLVSKAEVALENQIAPWLRKLDDDKREREKIARDIADKAEEVAREAHQAARQSDDLDEIEAAADLMAAAEDAARVLKSVEKEKTNIQVEGARAVHLRSVWSAVMIEGQASKALVHYAKTQHARVIDFIQILADEDVKSGLRGADAIPGFTIKEERVV